MNNKLIGPISLIKSIDDKNIFIVNEKLIFEASRFNLIITVLPGFRTDGASFPRALWPFISPVDGRYLGAAIIHDCLYESQNFLARTSITLSKSESDLIFLDCLLCCGVNSFFAKIMYNAVKYFGNSRWNKASDPRFIKIEKAE